MYYGNEPSNQNANQGYSYNTTNAQNSDPNNRNQYLPVNAAQNNNDQCNYNYPQTGLTIADSENTNTRTEILLPESVKVGLIMLSICCFLCFFILLLAK